jgi:UDP-galactopyranose mutase
MNFLVLSHLRWNFVFQRPQHLMTRCAQDHHVFFWEEPVFDGNQPFLEFRQSGSNLEVIVPHLPSSLTEEETRQLLQLLLHEFIASRGLSEFVLWYYTPMALAFSQELLPKATIYDCMDELSMFKGAPPGLVKAEAELFRRADLVFTGGRSLYEVKKHQHRSVHCFPSSIDHKHFQSARQTQAEPTDTRHIPRPRLGYCGVIDERMDLALLAKLAASRPSWQIVMLGPVVKIDANQLPTAPNIHYLGPRRYSELPSYLGSWDIGILPFAINDSTRFISPTKTPEYLAAGLPVVSTPIQDVRIPYEVEGLVRIAANAAEMIDAIEDELPKRHSKDRLQRVDKFLSSNSWDLTWKRMAELIKIATARKTQNEPAFPQLRASSLIAAADRGNI